MNGWKVTSVTGGPIGTPTLIVLDGPWTIIKVPVTDGGHQYVELPASADEGDLLEVYGEPPLGGPVVTPPGGQGTLGQGNQAFRYIAGAWTNLA